MKRDNLNDSTMNSRVTIIRHDIIRLADQIAWAEAKPLRSTIVSLLDGDIKYLTPEVREWLLDES
jgi:hypothetical protein